MPKVRRTAVVTAVVVAATVAAASPSSAAPTRAKTRSTAHPHAPSPALRAMLREVDRRRIQADIHTLAGFGTRHTLSSQTDPSAASARRATGSSSSSRATPPRRTGA